MKKILALSLALLSGSAFAQDTQDKNQKMETGGTDRVPAAAEGMRYMFEFNADSMLNGVLSFDKSKVNGSDSDTDTKANISLNYAYGVAPQLQIASRINYFNGILGDGDLENFDFSIGAIFNTKEDLTEAGYVSLYFGAGWSQDFGAGTRDDLRISTLAIGRRIPLTTWGLKHVTYTPEVAMKSVNSTTGEGLDYSTSLQFRFLQFSVFF
jgi:hypothetical protein